MASTYHPSSVATANLSTSACANCRLRKVRCDLTSHRQPPCSRCVDAELSCHQPKRRRRPIRTLHSATDPFIHNIQARPVSGPVSAEVDASATTKTVLDDVSKLFSTLGVGDEPRRIEVTGFGDISKQRSILVDFLSQDFSRGAIDDYQVTFNDNYMTIARLLANDFGQGFEDDVYHYRDAPFLKRSYGGIPRAMSPFDRAVVDLHGSFILPSASIADSFLAAFFDRVHPTLPILDRAGFFRRYYTMASKPSDISLLLLHSILLSGSTVFEHPSLALPAEEVSWKLHMRAKALIDSRFEQDRLVLVQAHLLFSTFVSDSCDDTIQNMWLSLGTAVRIAQGLGMHRALGKANASESMRRQWKRIWWSLFVHDTLCSFEWGRPRAINLADSDVEELVEDDFQPDDPGSLRSTEQTLFFIELCKLCFIIVDWLDLLRPGGSRREKANTADRHAQAVRLLAELQQWHRNLPPTLQVPKDLVGFSLWTATLHITYQAAMFRFCALMPESTPAMAKAAVEITNVCQDLNRQDLLGSLWNFGIRGFDLAMGQHARQANSKDREVASSGLQHLKRGIPWYRELAKRSSAATQGLMFYEELLRKSEAHVDPINDNEDVSTEGPIGLSTLESNGSTIEWGADIDFSDPLFQNHVIEQDPNAWTWDIYHY